MLSVIKFTPKAAKCLAASMRCATREWGDCGFRRNSGESVRSEYPRTLLQPDRATENSPWREPWEKGARGKPRMGRKTTAPRSFAPCRGFVNLAISPWLTPWAILCRSYELRFAAFTESQFFCRAPASMREAAHYRPDEPNPVALTSFDSQHLRNPNSLVAHPHQ